MNCILNQVSVKADNFDIQISDNTSSDCLPEEPEEPTEPEPYCINQYGNIVTDPSSAYTLLNWSDLWSDNTDAIDTNDGGAWCLILYPQDGGTIGDYIWLDGDGNGLQDAGEAAISGVTVNLYNAQDEYVASAVTNANGLYYFISDTDPRLGAIYSTLPAHVGVVPSATPLGGLPPDTQFHVRIDMTQAAVNNYGLTRVNVDNGTSDADQLDSDAYRVDDVAVIDVTTGELGRDDLSHDFGFGPFTSVIGGEAWNDLAVTGIQNPLIPNAKNVTVNLINWHDQLVATTVTPDSGHYTFDKLPAEDYVVEFRPATDTVWFSQKDQGTDDTLDSDVNVSNGRTDGITMANGVSSLFVDAGIVRGFTGNYSPQLSSPGDQSNAVGDSIHMILQAIDDIQDTITYQGIGLPPGLSIDSVSGHITGSPTTVGTYDVDITAFDGAGGIADISFVWTITQTPLIVCEGLEQEAEDGYLSGNFAKAIIDDGASGGQYVLVPDGTGNEWNGASSDNQVLFCFNVTTPGRYSIIGTTKAESDSQDSFFVTTNGSPAVGLLWDIAQADSYTDTPVTHRLLGNEIINPVEVWLQAGNQQVALSLREDGTRLDKLALVLVEEAVTPPCGDMTVEAEEGTLHGLFTIDSDPGASNGHYVHVPDGIGANWHGPITQDKVEYCFTVPEIGNYVLVGTVLASSVDNGSFYVTVDGTPSTGYLWDLAVNNAFVEDELNNRSGSDPVLLSLGAGAHTITVYQREDGAQLDKLSLIPATVVGAAGVNLPSTVQLPETSTNNIIRGTLEVPSGYRWEPDLAGAMVSVKGAVGYEASTVTNHVGNYYVDDVPDGEFTIWVDPLDENDDSEPLYQSTIVSQGTPTGASFFYQPSDKGDSIFLPIMQGRRGIKVPESSSIQFEVYCHDGVGQLFFVYLDGTLGTFRFTCLAP